MIIRVDRRSFLRLTAVASAGLVLGWPEPAVAAAASDKKQQVKHELTAFLQIDEAGDVTIFAARPDAGQGSRTGLAMIVAEEAAVDWRRVSVVQAGLDARLGQQYMAGSTATRESWEPLRKAGASARMMLIAAAAKRWNVTVDDCHAEEGSVVHHASGRRASYGELVADAAKLEVPKEPTLLDPASYRLIGKPLRRLDTRPIVTGQAIYGIDVRLPGMLYAAVARPAEIGATVASFDATKAKAVRGVRDVFVLEVPAPPAHYMWGGVAVVADSTWAAFEGQRALEVTWKSGPNAGENDMLPKLRELAKTGGSVARDQGQFDAALAAASSTIEAAYDLPFLAHAPMEPMNATVWLHDGIAEAWAPTQAPASVAAKVAAVAGLAVDKVKVHVTSIGGGFGRRLNSDFAWEAAMIAKRTGTPVKVTYTREDDMTHDYFRPASHHALVATFDKEEKLTGWRHRMVSPSINGFYGAAAGDPAEGVIGGADDIPLSAPNVRVEYTLPPTSLPRGWMRGVEHPANAFATQSFYDEIAAYTGKDPLAFRLEMLAGPAVKAKLPDPLRPQLEPERVRRVLDAVSRASKWGSALPKGRGRGIAFHYSRSYAAEVVEVSVTKKGELHVDRVVCAIDCGTVINPDFIRANAEGGVLFALSSVLYGQITFKNGAAEQSNFHDYPLARMADLPAIEVIILPGNTPPEGVGEVFVPPLAPALAGAIFAATGKRIRRLPLLDQLKESV